MQTLDGGSDDALRRLRQALQRRRIKATEVAREVVAANGGNDPGTGGVCSRTSGRTVLASAGRAGE